MRYKGYIALFMLILLILGGFMIGSYYRGFKTEVAVLFSIADSIDATGTVVRSEKLCPSLSGSLYYTVNDGEKVAKDAVIAERYSNAEEAANGLYLKRLEDELRMVESLSNEGRGTVNISSVRRSIYSLLESFSGEISSHDYSSAFSFRNQLLSLLSSYSIASGTEVSTEEYEQVLKDKIASVRGETASPSDILKSAYSGYYISYSDGCEGLADELSLEDITVEDAQRLIQNSELMYRKDDSSYRIVDDYDWYFVAVMPAADAKRLKPGYKYNVSFSYLSTKDIPGRVKSVTYDESGENAAVVIAFDRVNSELVQLRNVTASINFTNYKGIKVDRSALRIMDGKLGVFIKYGNTVKFRELNIIYETEDFVVSSVTEGNSSTLALYDEMIISGKDIYADKIIG